MGNATATGCGGSGGEGGKSTTMLAAMSEVSNRVGVRTGRLELEGRVHQLPRRVEDDYDLNTTALGSGYSGQVLAARGRRTGERVAVKTLRMKSFDKVRLEALAAEVEVYLSLDHPHIARLLEIYQTDDQVSLVMECCEGGELRKRVEENQAMPEAEAADATWQMLLAVNYLHSEGVVHRDLKLENFLYDKKESNFLKCIDYGFSRFTKKNKRMKDNLGTLSYVAPEVLAKDYTQACDMWSLGVIVFVLLSGSMPFAGRTDSEVKWAIQHGRYRMRTSRWNAVSEDAANFVTRLLVVSPQRRLTAEEALAHPWIARARRVENCGTVCHGTSIAHAFSTFAHKSRFRQAVLQMMAWTVSLEERTKLRDYFIQCLASQDGVISLQHLRDTLLKDKQFSMAEKDVDGIIETVGALDADGRGTLRYSYFLAAMMTVHDYSRETAHEETLGEIFHRFDSEGAGYLTSKRLKNLLGDAVPEGEIDAVFRKMHSESEGQVTCSEFVSYLRMSTRELSSSSEGETETEAPTEASPPRSPAKGRGSRTRAMTRLGKDWAWRLRGRRRRTSTTDSVNTRNSGQSS